MRDRDELHTERLLMRRWRKADRKPFAALNADPRVMALLPSRLSRDESDAFIASMEAHFEQYGYGLWAIEVSARGEFVGFAGLNTVTFDAHFTPAVEVGWRLARSAWGHGYATEAGLAALAFGFDAVRLDEIVSMTSEPNLRSQAVMERIGMNCDPADDFEHPLAESSRLRPHVLYRLSAAGWARLDATRTTA